VKPPSAETGTKALEPRVCATLADLTRSGLEEAITNPYFPPPFGSDDPHQGVDLAVFLPGTRIAISGAPVMAVLGGTASIVISGRFPYGNAVLVETPLTALTDAGWERPEIDLEIPVLTTLTCPGETSVLFDSTVESLYLLYAHLEALPVVKAGESVACGSTLGTIGESGNALNPHLHLEVRLGPSSAVFPGMAHYDASATAAEMDGYCAWRVGGQFRPVDPVSILEAAEW
jgi:murein DD-endopeptidase MepM/ murein hydrolase activator NlpD